MFQTLFGQRYKYKQAQGVPFLQFLFCYCLLKQMNFFEQTLNLEAYSHTDIVKKCKKYDEFKQQLQQIQIQYAHDLNMAIYASLEDVEHLGVFHVTHKPMLTISFYAYLMPPYEAYASKFYMLFIKLLDENLRLNVGKKYSIVYFHTLCQSNYPYNFLVTIFKKLPIYYYAMLDKIYTVGATFFLRKSAGLFDFGRLYKLFQRKLQNFEKISQFAGIAEINQMNVLDELPEKLLTELQYKTKKKLMKMQKQGIIPQKIYVPPPPKPRDFLTVNLKSHKLDKEGMPVPLSILLETLRSHPQMLDLQGIFRKSGSIEQQQEIIEELSKLESGDKFKKIDEYSGYAVAGVVKKFFTKLQVPIVPFALYIKLSNILSETTVKPEEEVSFILDFIQELPSLNRKILTHLINFLKKQVIVRHQKNKMNNYNMSVCFCPCIFRSQTPSLADLFNSGKFAGVLNTYFSRYQDIFALQQRSSSGSEEEKNSRTTTFKHFRISMA